MLHQSFLQLQFKIINLIEDDGKEIDYFAPG